MRISAKFLRWMVLTANWLAVTRSCLSWDCIPTLGHAKESGPPRRNVILLPPRNGVLHQEKLVFLIMRKTVMMFPERIVTTVLTMFARISTWIIVIIFTGVVGEMF